VVFSGTGCEGRYYYSSRRAQVFYTVPWYVRPRPLMIDLDERSRMDLETKLEQALQKVLRIHPKLHYVQVNLVQRS
jgi:hypothetical protein